MSLKSVLKFLREPSDKPVHDELIRGDTIKACELAVRCPTPLMPSVLVVFDHSLNFRVADIGAEHCLGRGHFEAQSEEFTSKAQWERWTVVFAFDTEDDGIAVWIPAVIATTTGVFPIEETNIEFV